MKNIIKFLRLVVIVAVIGHFMVSCPLEQDPHLPFLGEIKVNTGTSQTVMLSWTNKENADIEITIEPQEGSISKTATTAIITGLTNGKSYTVNIDANNSNGNFKSGLISIVPCDASANGGVKPSDFYGEWFLEAGDGITYTVQFIIGSLVVTQGIDMYVLENLTWTPKKITNENYQYGFAITGIIKRLRGDYYQEKNWGPYNSYGEKAQIGEIALDWWYINTDKRSISQGNWRNNGNTIAGSLYRRR